MLENFPVTLVHMQLRAPAVRINPKSHECNFLRHMCLLYLPSTWGAKPLAAEETEKIWFQLGKHLWWQDMDGNKETSDFKEKIGQEKDMQSSLMLSSWRDGSPGL